MQHSKIIRLHQKEQAPKHNLPVQLTSLLGREQEVVAACALLRRPEVRLLTFTGTGGVGKTRLALQIAEELLDDFADGVSFVSLAPLSDPDLVIPTLAQTLGLKERSNQSLLDLLKVYLRNKHLLLVLDNFEQVVTAAPLLVELLQTCPALKILVISRTLLRVSGEHEFLVPPLAVPNLKQLPEREVLAQYAAVDLFMQRAQALKPDFQMTSANAHAIAEICVRLDGLPLAIELAAARIKLLSPQALLARLNQRLQVLTSGTRDAPTRQQTLRNTIEWSYNLLDAAEQRLFRRLSIFVGGCTLEAIEAICLVLDGEAGQVFEGVASLLDKNLLQQIEQEEEEPRFVMLETVREFGLERLATSGEIEAMRQAHGLYYLNLAEKSELEFGGPQQVLLTIRLEQEQENLRAALQWLIEQEEREMALRLSGALWRFWRVRGPASEGLDWLEKALSGSDGVETSVRAKALYAAGELALLVGDEGRAAMLGEESLVLYRELGDKQGIAVSLMLLGQVASVGGNFVSALALHEESLALRRELEDRQGLAASLLYQGWMFFMRGDFTKAGEQFEESLQLFRNLGDREAIATALSALGNVASVQGEYAIAHALEQESLQLSRELADPGGLAASLFVLASIAFLQGDLAQASPLLEESLVLHREVGDKPGIAISLSLLGEVMLCQGDATRARSLLEESVSLLKEGVRSPRGMVWSLSLLAKVKAHQGDHAAASALYEESLAIAREMGHKLNIASCLEGLADILVVEGEAAWAARLWGTAEVLREAIGAPIPPVYRADYERSVTAARTQLGEQPFGAAWNEGRTMTSEQALAARGPLTMPTLAPAEPAAVPHPPKAATYPDGLTAREVEVLRLVAQGLTDAQVAEQLVISPRTVNSHLKAIYGKIQVSSRSAATAYALKHHLV